MAIEYKGLDIIPDMVALTNDRFGAGTAVQGDLFSYQSDPFDYVIASGTFNAKLETPHEEWAAYFYENLKLMFGRARKAAVFNCMTPHVDYRYDRLYYPSLEELSTFIVNNLSRNFIVDHSYPLYECTVAILKP